MRTTNLTSMGVCFLMLFAVAACSPSEEEKVESAGEEMAEESASAMDKAKEAGKEMAKDSKSAMAEAEEAGEKWADEARESTEEMGDEMKRQGEAIKDKSKEMYEDSKQAISDKMDEMANFGACYEKAGCNADDKISSSVTKSQCEAAGGESWYNSSSGQCESL